jgi:hypothetical protein
MIVLTDPSAILRSLCVANKKFGIRISIQEKNQNKDDYYNDLLKVAPWFDLKDQNMRQLAANQHGFLLFDNSEQMDKLFNETAPYDEAEGNIKIFLLLCDPEGNVLEDNS